MLTPSSYGSAQRLSEHRLALGFLAVLWFGIVLGAQMPWAGSRWWRLVQLAGVVAVLLAWRHRRRALMMLIAATTAVLVGSGAWWAVPAVSGGDCAGRATVVAEADGVGRGVRAVVRLDGVRLSVRAHGRPAWRLERMRVGESAMMSGTCRPVAGRVVTWQRSRHVLGEMSVTEVSETVGVAAPLARSVNRLHDALGRGARSLSPDDAALYAGLVVGSDHDQPQEMVQAFRRTGLGHLTAVSGQNVAYVITLVGLVVASRRRGVRIGATLVGLGWFALLTRAEPSVVRAVSAGVVTMLTGSVRGPSVAAGSIAAALMIDPMLAHSVGFQLSSSAAIGLTLGTGALTGLLGSGRWARVAAPTLAAQLATLPLSSAYFGLTPVVAIPANLCAAPVAGAVMLVGLPTGVVAAFLPDTLAAVVMAPVAVMVRWVWWVAHVGGSVRLPAWVDGLCWSAVVTAVIALWRRRPGHATPAS